jgi:hypothetical protein
MTTDQRSIVLYLAGKSLLAVAISEDLAATVGAEVINDPSVTRYVREAKSGTSIPSVAFLKRDHDCDQAISFT